ncbi:aminopeptidase P family protein [Parashewanella spongiae]|uniref:Aminopeptidase P family protein n=1 Tax=Parashewanella spongiae TaxID=342950 RepID=A0A3A6U7F8_9GAMM|nr:aminopeptidase P family protein [Parashewanella spongiae]MCL1079009.1 aminopeptidase P family protein [Parashewanella spongiae]RJY17835.1 aminopeptidase P family protein [Parashewanella spongiae]
MSVTPISINERLHSVRNEMRSQKLDAFIIPRADEYLGEYVPAHNERLLWATDFTGSAGAAIILKHSAAIFTDGRYTVQVRQQVDADQFDFESLYDTPQISYLVKKLKAGSRVGVDAKLHTYEWFKNAEAELTKAEITLVSINNNPVDVCWQSRPMAPTSPIVLFSDDRAGQTSQDKRNLIAEKVKQPGADLALVTALDSICWLLNIRGADVPRLPVVLSTALIDTQGRVKLFVDLNKLPDNIEQHVGQGVTFFADTELANHLAQLVGKKLLADPTASNAWIQLTAQKNNAVLIAGDDPIALLKAQKNSTELNGFRDCHVRDGLAVSRFLAWLDKEVQQNRLYDEGQLAEKLESFRKHDPLYQQPSFDTISAVGGNAAMCHYNHNNGTPAVMPMNSLYLVDSGAQYLDGTTDITRTVAIGKVTAEQKQMFTLVLKGHIALDSAKFPKGTTGQQLDPLARQYLWQYGYDYDHGTGHGVGHYLSVHEGPQRVGKNSNAVPLLEGMVISNEPGYYRANEFGIRIENLVAVTRCTTLFQPERETLKFEALTLAPIDARLLDISLMTETEIQWLNQYHKQVEDALSPSLTGEDLAWLQQATATI